MLGKYLVYFVDELQFLTCLLCLDAIVKALCKTSYSIVLKLN